MRARHSLVVTSATVLLLDSRKEPYMSLIMHSRKHFPPPQSEDWYWWCPTKSVINGICLRSHYLQFGFLFAGVPLQRVNPIRGLLQGCIQRVPFSHGLSQSTLQLQLLLRHQLQLVFERLHAAHMILRTRR